MSSLFNWRATRQHHEEHGRVVDPNAAVGDSPPPRQQQQAGAIAPDDLTRLRLEREQSAARALALEEELAEAAVGSDRLRMDLDAARRELARAADARERAAAVIAQQAQQLDDVVAAADTARSELRARDMRVRELQHELAAAKDVAAASAAELERHKAKAREFKATAESAIEKAVTKRDEMLRKVRDTDLALVRATADVEAARAEQQRSAEHIAQLTAALAEQRAAVKRLTDAAETAVPGTREREQLREQVAELSATSTHQQSELERARAQLQAMRAEIATLRAAAVEAADTAQAKDLALAAAQRELRRAAERIAAAEAEAHEAARPDATQALRASLAKLRDDAAATARRHEAEIAAHEEQHNADRQQAQTAARRIRELETALANERAAAAAAPPPPSDGAPRRLTLSLHPAPKVSLPPQSNAAPAATAAMVDEDDVGTTVSGSADPRAETFNVGDLVTQVARAAAGKKETRPSVGPSGLTYTAKDIRIEAVNTSLAEVSAKLRMDFGVGFGTSILVRGACDTFLAWLDMAVKLGHADDVLGNKLLTELRLTRVVQTKGHAAADAVRSKLSEANADEFDQAVEEVAASGKSAKKHSKKKPAAAAAAATDNSQKSLKPGGPQQRFQSPAGTR